MRRKIASLCLAAGLATAALVSGGRAAMAGCKGQPPGEAGPYYDLTAPGAIGVTDGNGSYVELNGGLFESPKGQIEANVEGFGGGYINTDGNYGLC